MRKSITIAVAITFASALFIPAPANAANPPGTGQPGQSCQALEPFTPGHSATAPGSAFNEPGINSINGGISGMHYSESSQYDVACFQMSQH